MRPYGFANMPMVTKNLLIINVLLFALKAFLNAKYDLDSKLDMHFILSSNFRPHQIITHMFMHADIMHLLFNMLGLWIFGSMLENVWGPKRFLIFYFITGIGACMCDQIYLYFSTYSEIAFWKNVYESTNNPFESGQAFEMIRAIKDRYLMLGASGAGYGLIMGAALLFPNTQMYVYMVIPVKLKYLAIFYGLSELFLTIQKQPGDNIGHLVHLGGMLFSFIMIRLWRKDRSNFY
ncbi:MAG: rhomboid family intramembrane serine protease [Bacteroidia bacterium]|nr:rhomboid family intramembrane serine protease [Bacteroidia bacterium]